MANGVLDTMAQNDVVQDIFNQEVYHHSRCFKDRTNEGVDTSELVSHIKETAGHAIEDIKRYMATLNNPSKTVEREGLLEESYAIQREYHCLVAALDHINGNSRGRTENLDIARMYDRLFQGEGYDNSNLSINSLIS